VGVPTDWASFLAAAKALKKIGVYGYVTAAASSNSAYGTHTLAAFMINNGGGMFDEQGNADCMYDRNVEAVEYLLELVKGGYVDPGSASYVDTDVYTELKNGKAGMALANPTIPQECGTDPVHGDLVVMSPIKGPHGDVGTIQYLKNYQMYTKTPSIAGSEKFMIWWNELFAGKKGFFAQGITAAVPVRKSVIALPEIQADPQLVKIIKEWVPVAKPESARYPAHLLRPGHGRQRHGHGPVHPVDPGGEDHGDGRPADPAKRDPELRRLLQGVIAEADAAPPSRSIVVCGTARSFAS